MQATRIRKNDEAKLLVVSDLESLSNNRQTVYEWTKPAHVNFAKKYNDIKSWDSLQNPTKVHEKESSQIDRLSSIVE